MDLDEIKDADRRPSPPPTSRRWSSPAASGRCISCARPTGSVAADAGAGGDRAPAARQPRPAPHRPPTRRVRAPLAGARLPESLARRARRSSRSGGRSRPATWSRHRGDEGLQRDPRRARRDRRGDARRLRRRGRGRPAAHSDRVGTMFNSVLIANRGEIALRIQRACRALGPAHDRRPLRGRPRRAARPRRRHRRLHRPGAGRAALPRPGGDPARGRGDRRGGDPSGLRLPLGERRLRRARSPRAGLTFIGPSADCIRTMGDKVAAKRAMLRGRRALRAGPGRRRFPTTSTRSAASSSAIGYPVILKAAGGGGGRGMRVVTEEGGLAEALRADPRGGAPRLRQPRDLRREVPDRTRATSRSRCWPTATATRVWLGSRDCSLQRRHQKVLEEAPAPGLAPELVAEVGERCAEACRQIGYEGVGTFEFLFEDGVFFFIEMNTRVQVEHPITEDDDRHRHRRARASASPRGCRCPSRRPTSPAAATPSSAGSTPRTRRPSRPRPGVVTRWEMPGGPGIRSTATWPPAGTRAALLRLADRQAHRPRRDPRGGAGPPPRSRSPRRASRASRPTCRCTAGSSPTRASSPAASTSTTWSADA